jgi:hypothetical protein
MLVKQIDPVGAQTAEHALDDELDVLGPAVEPRAALTRFLVDVPAELAGDDDLVAKRLDAFTQDPFDLVGTLGLRRVEEVTPRSNAVRMMLCISGREGIVVW